MNITNSYRSYGNTSYNNSSCDEVLLSRSVDWIVNTDNDGDQISSSSKPSNPFFGDSEKVNSALKVPEKSYEDAMKLTFTKKESSKTKPSIFLHIKNEGSKSIDNAMSRLADVIGGMNENNQLRAFAELAKLLESEDTKHLLGLALNGDYSYLIEMASKKGWVHLKNILIRNTCEQPVSSMVNHNGNGNICNNSHDNIEKKISISLILSAEILYPYFSNDDNGILLEDSFIFTIMNEGENKKINKKRIKDLVQAYPLFANEAKILKCLCGFDNKHKEYVLRFFKELVRNSLPGQLQKSAPLELNALHQKFKTEKILNSFEKKHPADPAKVQINHNHVMFTDWRDWDAGQFSRAFAFRDCRLIQAIKFNDVTKWLHGLSEQPESVALLDKTYETTAQWIAFQIVSELDKERRKEIIKKFFDVGCILNGTYKNIHSASQIARAFKHPSVMCLLQNEYYCNSDFHDLLLLTDDDYYYDSKVEIGNTLFPINQTFWRRLQSEYRYTYDFNHLADITKYALKLKNFHTFNIPQMNNQPDDIHSFVSNLESVPFNTINELSFFFHKMEGYLKDSKVKLADWDAGDLAHFILKKRDDVVILDEKSDLSLLKSLYSQGIYNGKQFIKAFSKNKALIESEYWPFEKKLAIWTLYLLHLSPSL